MFRSWAASVKFADEMNTASPSTTTHFACRQARFSAPSPGTADRSRLPGAAGHRAIPGLEPLSKPLDNLAGHRGVAGPRCTSRNMRTGNSGSAYHAVRQGSEDLRPW